MAEIVRGIRIKVTLTSVIVGDDAAEQRVIADYDRTFTDGTAADNLGNAFYDASRNLNAGAEDIDLGAGGVTDFQGADIVATSVGLIWAENLDTDTGDWLKLTKGTTNPMTSILEGTAPKLTIGPGGLCLLVNPADKYTAANGSADTIGFETADNTNYKLFVGVDNA